MVNMELVKLVGILSAGIAILAGGFYLQKKNQSKNSVDLSQYQQNPEEEFSPDPSLKEYIETYKSQFQRDDIKQVLVNYGYSEDIVEKHLQRFF